MATRRWWAGTLGPFFYDDSIAPFRFETAAGTIEVGSLAGQTAESVNIDGGNIDATVIGAASPEVATFRTLTVSGPSGDVSITDIVTSTPTLAASPAYYIEVQVGASTTGYVPVYLPQ